MYLTVQRNIIMPGWCLVGGGGVWSTTATSPFLILEKTRKKVTQNPQLDHLDIGPPHTRAFRTAVCKHGQNTTNNAL